VADTFVQPEVLKSQILDVRNALGDSAKRPHFIETLPRRGYQFIAAVTGDGTASPPLAARQPVTRLAGRETELHLLHDYLTAAIHGKRRILFLTGEPGIGKTALVDQFLSEAPRANSSIRLARGQCLEGYGGKEAYYPMLETLGQLCRGPGGDAVVKILEDHAPTWLVQFPALLRREHRQTLQREILGATRERMLREIGEAIDAISSITPLVLVFEDLQWVDPSTVDLISALARGRRPARLMLVATYRPGAATASRYPLQAVKQDLLIHDLCKEVVLGPLREEEVAEYLQGGSPATEVPEGLAELVHRHSDGNPLFMVAALDHMVERGLIARANDGWRLLVPLEKIDPGVPESLRQMIEAQIGDLTAAEQQVLEVASIAGTRFCSRISAAAGLSQETFEERCEGLSRRNHLLRWVDSDHLPDGIACQRYEFAHALYREVFYRRQPAGRRAKLHYRIGMRLEELFPHCLKALAPELAHHFEMGADWKRAVYYLGLVADTARRRYAHHEAAAVLEHALELLNRLPDAERSFSSIEILEKLAGTYVVLFDPRTVETYELLASRAAEQGLVNVEVRALIGLALPMASISSQQYLAVLDRALRLSAAETDPVLRAKTRSTCLVRRMAATGWNRQEVEECRDYLQSMRESDDPATRASYLIDYGFIQSFSSEYRKAHRNAAECVELLLAECEESPYQSIAHWLTHRSLFFLGEWGKALREIDAAISTLEKNGDAYRVHTLRLQRALVHLSALDFTGALEISGSMVSQLPSIKSPTARRLCLIVAGTAEAGLGHHETALDCLLSARKAMDREAAVFDWYWRIRLEAALADLWLAQNDLARAKPQAKRFLDASLATAERTWQVLAWETNARLAMAEHDAGRAQASIGRAFSTMEGYELPVAAWRVYLTAAEIEESRGRGDLAASHYALARHIILKVADSLPADSPLRTAFLSAVSVSRVLERP
jgi:hypothetical protein